MIPVLLMAAGMSRRMAGRDKLLEPVDGMPLLLRQARMVAELRHPVFVTLPDPEHPRARLLRDAGPKGQTPVWVPDRAEGMGRSLKAGLKALPGDAAGVLIVLADMPDIEAADLRALLHAYRARPNADVWRGTTQDWLGGHPLILSAALLAQADGIADDTGARDLIRAANADGRLVPVPLPGERALTDLDTPADWADWRAANPER